MKKSNFLFLLLLALSLMCCDSGSDSPEETEANIIGTWKLISDIEEGIEYVNEGDCDFFWVFTETTFDYIEYYGMECTMKDPTTPVSYSIQNNMILGPFDDDPEGIVHFEILELTTNNT